MFSPCRQILRDVKQSAFNGYPVPVKQKAGVWHRDCPIFDSAFQGELDRVFKQVSGSHMFQPGLKFFQLWGVEVEGYFGRCKQLLPLLFSQEVELYALGRCLDVCCT